MSPDGWLVWAVVIGLTYWLFKSRRPARPNASAPTVRPPVPLIRRLRWFAPPEPRITAEVTSGIRDGLTGAPIEPGQRTRRCTRCHTAYHEASHATLLTDNDGRCLSCLATTFEPFGTAETVDAGEAITLTARVWWVGAAAEPGFYVAVLENKPWREARKLIFPPTFTARPKARDFIASLADRQVTVRGPLASDGPLGPRIVVTRRSMVRPTTKDRKSVV